MSAEYTLPDRRPADAAGCCRRSTRSKRGDGDADTLLVGRLADRAALHGFIARIEALGLELVELQRLPHRLAANGCLSRMRPGRRSWRAEPTDDPGRPRS